VTGKLQRSHRNATRCISPRLGSPHDPPAPLGPARALDEALTGRQRGSPIPSLTPYVQPCCFVSPWRLVTAFVTPGRMVLRYLARETTPQGCRRAADPHLPPRGPSCDHAFLRLRLLVRWPRRAPRIPEPDRRRGPRPGRQCPRHALRRPPQRVDRGCLITACSVTLHSVTASVPLPHVHRKPLLRARNQLFCCALKPVVFGASHWCKIPRDRVQRKVRGYTPASRSTQWPLVQKSAPRHARLPHRHPRTHAPHQGSCTLSLTRSYGIWMDGWSSPLFAKPKRMEPMLCGRPIYPQGRRHLPSRRPHHHMGAWRAVAASGRRRR
jgi:hypothetical protein